MSRVGVDKDGGASVASSTPRFAGRVVDDMSGKNSLGPGWKTVGTDSGDLTPASLADDAVLKHDPCYQVMIQHPARRARSSNVRIWLIPIH